MAPYTRVAFAQIAANPAYVDDSGVSLLMEPVFPGEDKIGLHTVGGIQEIHQLRMKIAAAFETHISAKVEAVCAFAANQNVDLLVFPEYSIPSSVLDVCKQLSDLLQLTIVAGSHVATQHSLQHYKSIGLAAGEDMLNRAVCPIFTPANAPRLRQKLTRSKWESSLVPGDSAAPLDVAIHGKRVFLQVLICLDAISESVQPKPRSSKMAPSLYVVPSLSPQVELFYDRARLLLASNHVTLFVNGADFGGSRAFARSERTNSWYTTEDGTLPIQKHQEGGWPTLS